MKRFLALAFEGLSSFGFAVVLLFYLFVLTLVGTLQQQWISLYEVQEMYFNSYLIPGTPFPGVHLTLVLLFVNLVSGGMVRIRKSSTTAGILVVHVGILVLLGGSLVEYHASDKGHMSLFEGERSAEFQSYFDWEINVAEARESGPVSEYVIPGEQFMTLRDGATATFASAHLPFDLTVTKSFGNCSVHEASPGHSHGSTAVVDGFSIHPLPREMKAEYDTAGAYVTLREKASGAEHAAILWGRNWYPFNVNVEGRRWTVDLHHRRWTVPFTVVLDDFRKEDHPGLNLARSFESDITKIENGVPQRINISMNEPLRHEGYVLFQSGWGPPDAPPGSRLYSDFSVVRNPADQVPLYACIIIAMGLLLHFCRRLYRHVRIEAGRHV